MSFTIDFAMLPDLKVLYTKDLIGGGNTQKLAQEQMWDLQHSSAKQAHVRWKSRVWSRESGEGFMHNADNALTRWQCAACCLHRQLV